VQFDIMASTSRAFAANHGPLDAAQAGAVAAALNGLNAEQLTWVSGYLAGLAARQTGAAGAPASAADEQPSPAPAAAALASAQRMTVLYGSQTGNGRAIAEELAEQARSRGFEVVLGGMADYRVSALQREHNLLVVVSTHGEGEPPDDAESLHAFLASRRAPRLDQLHYSVLALGDSSYEHFCQTGRDFDQRLAALGATRLHALVECDVDYDDPAAQWSQGVLDEMEQRLGALRASQPAAPVRPSVQLRAVDTAQRHGKTHPFPAPVLACQPITGRGSGWPVHHVELLLEGSGMDYLPGDALGVLPHNPPPLVDAVLAVLGAAGDEPVPRGKEGRTGTLHEALSRELEITVLTRKFVEQYAQATGSAALIERLASDDRSAFNAWLGERQIIDVLREHPGEVEPVRVAGMLRTLTPRLYSIASSPLANPDEVHLTVAKVHYQAFGYEHYGAASTYLTHTVGEGDQVPVYVQPNERFRLPADGDVPIIMVGPGTGVAPFRAFVEHRRETGASGRNWLFFGGRHFDTDFLYQLEWLRYLKQGTLARLDVAFSRDQSEKCYVQHRMQERSRELFTWLEDGAHVYVCGDASRMAGDVHQALLGIIAREGGYSGEQAGEYLQDMKRIGRYQRDVY
jgi:sulfite reductase (NADPH) flavoprotein alpha-component